MDYLLCGNLPYPAWKKHISVQNLSNRRIRRYLVCRLKRPEARDFSHVRFTLGYEPEHYLDMLENVETIKSDIEITKQNIAEPSDEWKDIVYHKYNDDRTSYECVPCYNSVDEYIASEKEDLESYKADLEEALEELKDMRADWKPEKEPNMDEEIELIKKWVKEREDFINE